MRESDFSSFYFVSLCLGSGKMLVLDFGLNVTVPIVHSHLQDRIPQEFRSMRLRKVTLVFVAIFSIAGLFPITTTAHPNRPAGMLEVETLLSKLGYWIIKADGIPDASTHHAIMAFQKVEGLKRTGTLSAADLKVLRAAERPMPRY